MIDGWSNKIIFEVINKHRERKQHKIISHTIDRSIDWFEMIQKKRKNQFKQNCHQVFIYEIFFSEQERKKHQTSNIKHQTSNDNQCLLIDDWWLMIWWWSNDSIIMFIIRKKLLLNKITNYKLFILMEPSNQPTNQKNIRSDLKNIFLFAFDFFFKNLAFLVCGLLTPFLHIRKMKKKTYTSLSLSDLVDYIF